MTRTHRFASLLVLGASMAHGHPGRGFQGPGSVRIFVYLDASMKSRACRGVV
jgi:hypothetical protein